MTPTRWKTDCWAVVDKPVVTQRITLRELQHAAISPKNNRPIALRNQIRDLLQMITGGIKTQIDGIWNSFWSGGISNPLEVIEQITYLLFLRRLDDMHMLEENKANRLEKPMEQRVFPEGEDAKGRAYEDFRWSRFRHFAPGEMFTVVGEHVFPYLRADLARQLGGANSTYARHMKDARFTIPTSALLAKVVDLLDKVPMEERDTKGDVYEYMLGKIATAGQNGQFRTPRHIIRMMVELTAPQPADVVCDPACGTAGFLVATGEYLRGRLPKAAARREAGQALPPRPVPRLRLRQHDAAHRQHEHAVARRGEPGHPLPGLASRRTTPVRRRSTRWCWPIRPSPAASTMRIPPRTCCRSSRPRRRSCSSSRSSSGS